MDISKLPRLSQTPSASGDAPGGTAPAEAGGPASIPVGSAASPPAPSAWCPVCHAPNAVGSQFCNNCGGPLQGARGGAVDYARQAADPGAGAEAWISIAVGVILLLMAPNTIKYLTGPAAFEQAFTITDGAGNKLSYPQSVFFWGDLSLTLFAFVLIVDGLIVGFVRHRGPVLAAFALTAMATALNIFYVAGMMTKGYGFQIMSALAIAFGVYIALYQWRLWLYLRDRAAA